MGWNYDLQPLWQRSSSLLTVRSRAIRWLATCFVFGFLILTLLLLKSGTPSLAPLMRPLSNDTDKDTVDWSRFAYTQYVTNSDYLCNSVMFFEALHRLGSRAERAMMFPADMLAGKDQGTVDARLLKKSREEYNVKLVPISVQRRDGVDATWAESFTKLLAFNQTQYDRVLSIDSDSTVLQHLDELFHLPPTPVAMPRAYWLYPNKQILSSQVMLVQPSKTEFDRVMEKVDSAGPNDYDMEIVNWLYKDNALVLPHRPYDMLTSEFRAKDHASYLGSDVEPWDPVAIYNEAKLAHFSDWPIPKPWIDTPEDLRQEMQPDCVTNSTDGPEDCTSRIIWNNFYSEFRERRKKICDFGLTKKSFLKQ